MNTKLLSMAAAIDHFDRDAAHRQYVELLVSGKVSDADAAKLNELMKQLGITTAQANADVAMIAKAREHLASVERCRGIDGKADAVGTRIDAHDRAKAEWLEKWARDRAALLEEQSVFGRTYMAGERALIDLRAQMNANGPTLAAVGIRVPTKEEFAAIICDKSAELAKTK